MDRVGPSSRGPDGGPDMGALPVTHPLRRLFAGVTEHAFLAAQLGLSKGYRLVVTVSDVTTGQLVLE